MFLGQGPSFPELADTRFVTRAGGFGLDESTASRHEMYVPKHKRKFGCYVMPVLAGDRLIGRVVPRVDRRRGVLVVEGMFAEPGLAGAGGAAGRFGGGGDRVARVVRGRRFGQSLRPGGVRRILSTGESAGRSRRAQAR